MAATTFGDIVFGLTAETGFYAESISFDYSIQEKWIGDGDGDTMAGAMFKPEMTGSIDGAYKSTGTPTWTLGTNLTVASIIAHTGFITGASAGRLLTNSASVTLGNESERRQSIGFVYKPFLG